jgi:hypothetical protein
MTVAHQVNIIQKKLRESNMGKDSKTDRANNPVWEEKDNGTKPVSAK